MSAELFYRKVGYLESIAKNDRVWFPKWMRRYALSFPGGGSKNLPVTRQSVIDFSRALLSNQAPAWQRWQAVRAVECYRNIVLERSEPDLSDVIQTLANLGKRERNIALDAPPTAEELQQLRGNLNSAEPKWIQTMRSELRVLHYAMATERAYVRWVHRFIQHVGSQELEQFNEIDIGQFLTHLAVHGGVAQSTQRQALSSLLFLYQSVIGKRLGFVDAARVRKSEPLPVWFSRREIEKLLGELTGSHRLMFLLKD